ncbi:MAG: MinD/ParA family protein [Porticoccaceae bacterium]
MVSADPIRVVAVTSGKGGVGKTNVSVNLALAMAAQGRRVLLMDADLGLANVDVLLGLRPLYNLSHVILGERTLEEILIDGPGGIKIVPAASGVKPMAQLSMVEHAALVRGFSDLSLNFDTLLVDTAAGISDSVITFSRAAQDVIVVVRDEPTSLADGYALIKVLNRDHGIGRFHVLSNMSSSPQEGQATFAKLANVAARFLDVTLSYLGTIPYDECLIKAVRSQRSVVEAYPGSRSAQAFKNLARAADKWPKPFGPSGHLEFLVERLIGPHRGGAEALR